MPWLPDQVLKRTGVTMLTHHFPPSPHGDHEWELSYVALRPHLWKDCGIIAS